MIVHVLLPLPEYAPTPVWPGRDRAHALELPAAPTKGDAIEIDGASYVVAERRFVVSPGRESVIEVRAVASRGAP